jgi:LuxR family quorum sensing-dependent transcriptional regulator
MSATRILTLDFISQLKRSTATEEVLAILRTVGDSVGYENFCVAGMPSPNEDFASYVMLSGWPEDWFDHYNRKAYVHVDPVIARLKATTSPFEWREAQYDRSRGSSAALMMNEAADFGLAHGFCVPIYSMSGFQAAVSFGARSWDIDDQFKGSLHLIAIYAHGRLRELLAPSGNRAAGKATALSAREIETLKWSAEGKTAWEISVILGLSEKTIEKFLASAARKLDATNRVHTVAQAFRANILT